MGRLLALAVAATALVLTGIAQAEGPKSLGTVGPGFTIQLTDSEGARVTSLPAGPSEIAIDDRGEEHNFHLTGPGVDLSTSVEAIERVSWQVTLQDGVYTYVCDPHSGRMSGSFRVGAAGAEPPVSAPAPAPPATRVVATVGPGPTITLRSAAGKTVKRLVAGAYVIEARDRSSSQNVHLVGAGIDRRTGVSYRGVVTWEVKLRAGTLQFRSDPGRLTLRGAVIVTA
jgi:hypothetical protein